MAQNDDVYYQVFDQLERARQSAFEQFDKAILTLSSGGLGLSLAFLKDVVKTRPPVGEPILVVSWVLFAVSILSTLVSFLFSERAIVDHQEFARRYYLESNQEYRDKVSCYSTATKIANLIAAFMFLSAVVLSIIFVSTNI